MRITSKGKRVNSIDFHGLIFRICARCEMRITKVYVP